MRSKRVYGNKPRGRGYRNKSVAGALGAIGTAVAGAVINKVRKSTSARAAANAVKSVFKPRPAKKRTYKNKKTEMNPMAKRLAALEKEIRGATSVLTYKVDSSESLRQAVCQANNGYRNIVYTADIESAIAQCRYFDPTTSGTLITGSLASASYQQKIRIAVWTRTIMKNSYMVPCVVTYAIMHPRQATSISPTSAFTQGLADQGNPTQTSYLLSPNDSIQLKQLWKPVKWYHKTLMPGESITVKYNQPAFYYDPAYFDSETETWNSREKSAVVFYRVKGVLSHDTAATQIGIGASAIDVQSFSTYRIYYNSGGASINTIVLAQGATSAFTNGAVTGMGDIPDNIAYSVA